MDWVQDSAWWLWLVGAVVLAGVETLTLDLIFLMLAVGALGGTAAALLGAELWLQGVVFAVVALGMLVAVRPIALKNLKGSTPDSRSYLETLAGREATAEQEITADGGLLRIDGDTWTARTAPDSPRVRAGEDVEIVRVDGATLVVRALPAIDWHGSDAGPVTP